MKGKNLFKIAFQSLLKNKMRSLLTSLGIIIGVSAVIVMVAIGEGSQKNIEEQINSLGADMIMIMPGSRQMGGVSQGGGSYNRLTLEDAEKLAEQTTLCKAVSPEVRAGGQVIGSSGNWNTITNGVSPEYLYIRSREIEDGEMFTKRDIRAKSKVCVLGQTVIENIFGDEDPIGQRIRIGNTPFKVIGTLAEKGEGARGEDQDDMILAPSTTVLYRLKGGQYINMIFASAISTDMIVTAQEELVELMRTFHKLEDGEDDDFIVRNQAEITETVSETSRVLTMLLASIAAVSLIVGGIGIMNIMLVSVTERTREIGIRLSIGARENDIMTQFLLEAIVLSLAGGVIGVLLSIGTALALNTYGLTTVIDPTIVFIAFGFSGAVGIFFGFYPARKAAVLNPIDALRHE